MAKEQVSFPELHRSGSKNKTSRNFLGAGGSVFNAIK
jgi:hypothetical protein